MDEVFVTITVAQGGTPTIHAQDAPVTNDLTPDQNLVPSSVLS